MHKKGVDYTVWIIGAIIILVIIMLIWAAFQAKVGAYVLGWALP